MSIIIHSFILDKVGVSNRNHFGLRKSSWEALGSWISWFVSTYLTLDWGVVGLIQSLLRLSCIWMVKIWVGLVLESSFCWDKSILGSFREVWFSRFYRVNCFKKVFKTFQSKGLWIGRTSLFDRLNGPCFIIQVVLLNQILAVGFETGYTSPFNQSSGMSNLPFYRGFLDQSNKKVWPVN